MLCSNLDGCVLKLLNFAEALIIKGLSHGLNFIRDEHTQLFSNQIRIGTLLSNPCARSASITANNSTKTNNNSSKILKIVWTKKKQPKTKTSNDNNEMLTRDEAGKGGEEICIWSYPRVTDFSLL